HFAQQVDGPINVRAKGGFGGGRVFAEMSREMNDDVVGSRPRRIERIQNVEMRTVRKILGIKESADVTAKKTAAACNEDSQYFLTTCAHLSFLPAHAVFRVFKDDAARGEFVANLVGA